MELFGDLAVEDAELKLENEKAVIEYSQKIGAIVNKLPLKSHVVAFLKQLTEEVYPKLTSAEYAVSQPRASIVLRTT